MLFMVTFKGVRCWPWALSYSRRSLSDHVTDSAPIIAVRLTQVGSIAAMSRLDAGLTYRDPEPIILGVSGQDRT